jgi:hypothetical protein
MELSDLLRWPDGRTTFPWSCLKLHARIISIKTVDRSQHPISPFAKSLFQITVNLILYHKHKFKRCSDISNQWSHSHSSPLSFPPRQSPLLTKLRPGVGKMIVGEAGDRSSGKGRHAREAPGRGILIRARTVQPQCRHCLQLNSPNRVAQSRWCVKGFRFAIDGLWIQCLKCTYSFLNWYYVFQTRWFLRRGQHG